MLVAIVVGSGIFATRLSPDDRGLQLLENAIATGAGLVALILCLGSVSGALPESASSVSPCAERFCLTRNAPPEKSPVCERPRAPAAVSRTAP